MVVVWLVLIVDRWNCFGYCWVWVKLLIGVCGEVITGPLVVVVMIHLSLICSGLFLGGRFWWLFFDCGLGFGGCYVEVWWLMRRGGGSCDSGSGGVWGRWWCLLLDFDFVWVRVWSWVGFGFDALWGVDGEWVVGWCVYVSKWWVNRVNVTFSFFDCESVEWCWARIVELVLVVSKLSIMITVILINSPGVIFGVA